MAKHSRSTSGHGNAKFPRAGLLASSLPRGWEDVLVEQRAHPRGEIPAFTPSHTEITMILGGDGIASTGPARVLRRGNGVLQNTPALPGTIWLCPAGVYEDRIRLTGAISSVLHIYLPRQRFASFAEDHGFCWYGAEQVRYEAGLRDPLIEGIGRALHGELVGQTGGGSLLAESLAVSLTARLMTLYSDRDRKLPRGPGALDARRLSRAVDFIEANLQRRIDLKAMARAASLSEFHFTRAFRAATGSPPYQFVIQRRMTRAMSLLRRTDLPLGQIAYECGFSTLSDFSRTFARHQGVPPRRYREASR